MSNLGWYQVITKMAKKVGGPLHLAGILVGGGAVLGGGSVLIGQEISKKVNMHRNQKKRDEETDVEYEVFAEGESNEGLVFNVGDKFKVLEIDGDAVLIEIIGDIKNPYFVSRKFISTISDFQK